MTANSTQRAAELSALIARHSTLPPHQIAAHVLHLQRIARQAVTIATNLCNIPDYQETFDRRISRLRFHADDICLALQPSADADHMVRVFRTELGGDPRGPCLRLLIEGERGDGWDADNDGTGSYALY